MVNSYLYTPPPQFFDLLAALRLSLQIASIFIFDPFYFQDSFDKTEGDISQDGSADQIRQGKSWHFNN